MNATAQSTTEHAAALQDLRRLVAFAERWGIADRVLTITRSLYGCEPTILLHDIADIEHAFRGTGYRLQQRTDRCGGPMHAELMVSGVRVCACGPSNGRPEGEVTL